MYDANNNAWGDTTTKGREGQEKRNAPERNETKRNETKWNTTESEKAERKEEKGEMEHNRERKTGTKAS